jgi:hypothetical protein
MELEECLQLIEKVVKAFDESVYMLASWHQDAYLELKLYVAGIEAAVKGEDISGRVYIGPFGVAVEAEADCGKCEAEALREGDPFAVYTCGRERRLGVVEIGGVKYTADEFYRFIAEKFEAVLRHMAEYIKKQSLQRKI